MAEDTATELLNRASAVDPALALLIDRDRRRGMSDEIILLVLRRAIANETKRREDQGQRKDRQ